MTTTLTHGTLNLLKKNSRPKVEADIAKAITVCDVLGMQEVWRDALRQAVAALDARPDWEVHREDGPAGALPIAWRTDVFDPLPGAGHRRTHKGIAGLTPSRYVVWQPLLHKASGLRLLVLNTHVINAYAGQDRAPRKVRDRLAEDHWREVVDVTEQFVGRYDALLLGGDFNVRLGNLEEPWYPGRLLAPLYVFDHPGGIDHTLVSKGSPLRVVRHGHVRHLHSDHDLNYTTYALDGHTREPRTATEEPVMRFVSRAAWGSSGRVATPSSHPIGHTRGITAHWEGPGIGGFPHSLCARKVRSIERFHKVTRGWADIAYNAVVCPHGYVFEGRGPNVRSAANGVSNIGGNDEWYAVCYLGGTGDPFTKSGKAGFLDAFDWLAREGAAGPERNGHRDHHATTCPGDAIYAWVHSPAAHRTPTTDWFDMATLEELQQAIRDTKITLKRGDHTQEVRLEGVLRELEEEQDRIKAALEQIVGLLAARPPGATTVVNQADLEAVKGALRAVLVEGVGTGG